MKAFLDQHFLLKTETSISLYENTARELPIFDFHCHLNPQEVWENKAYQNITQLWLGADHYKWRAMRMHGIGETYITGEASDWEKFMAWATTLSQLIGNPLYHWTHMELKTFFGINKLLNPATAREIYEECNEKLQTDNCKPRSLIERSHVIFIGTTDDPVSTLEYHQRLRNDPTFKPTIAPTFRPDGAFYIERPAFENWVSELEKVSLIPIDTFHRLLLALKQRIHFFHENGGRASDHDIPFLEYVDATKEEADAIFRKRLNGESLSPSEITAFRSILLQELGKMYAEKQWVMQLHMGALRNTNSKMKEMIGPDTGFDSVGESNLAEGLAQFLDALDCENALPRTILFNLNPKDNPVLAGMMGNFYEEGLPGKIQFGSAWWYNDHIDGMEKQVKDLANVGLLSYFIGMTTDSRSLLSYPRHDYFRRILCNIIGEWVENGLVPYDEGLLTDMITKISYQNAERFFLKR